MLHIHNGDSVAATARRASLPGRHLPFRESLIAGPIPTGASLHEWIEERARFLSETYEQNLLRVRNDLLDQEKAIEEARHEDEVILWFEHDLYCLVHFIYLLGRLAKNKHLTMIWSPQPLGAADEAELINLFNSRAAVPPMMIRIAAEAWSAYTADDAAALNRFLNPNSEFAFLADGFRLHASRFPSVRNGLGEVEKRALEGISAGALDFMALFARFDQSPPRYGFGDGEFLRHLRRLATSAIPMLTITEAQGTTPPKLLFALTPAGQSVLDGKADFIELNNAGYWLGGVYLTREKMWRWDGSTVVRA